MSEPSQVKILVAMPAYNEERYVGSVVLKDRQYADEVIVLDDGSTDDTSEVARLAGATVFRHEENKGCGAAIQSLLAEAKERNLERIFEQHHFGYVYHLAAEYGRWNGEDYYENLWETNAIGTKHLIRLQEKLKFRMIFFSSAEVYGDYDGVMSEDVMDKLTLLKIPAGHGQTLLIISFRERYIMLREGLNGRWR